MNRQFLKIEDILLSAFPLIYCLLIIPGFETYNVFFIPKINLLLAFIIIMTLLRFIVSKDADFSTMLNSLRKPRSYDILLGCFLVSIAISTLISNNKTQSVFGTANFHTGAYFMLLLVLVFWLYSSARKASYNGLILLAVVFSGLTILEYLGFRPLASITNAHVKLITVFPAVTVGYRGQVAGVSIILSLLPLYWFRDRYNDWRFWGLFTLGIAGLGCTTNSSAIIGFMFTIILFVIISKKTLLTMVFIPLVAIVSLNAYRPLAVLSSQLSTIGWVDGKADSKDFQSTLTLKTRFILWEAGLRMFAAKPVFGWGPQTYNQHWFDYISQAKGDQLYRLELGLKPEQKLIRRGDTAVYTNLDGQRVPAVLNYTAPHSAVIDLLYSQGIVGFSLFVLFLVFLVWYMSKRMGRVVWFALLPLIGYFIYLGAWFITVPATGLAAIVLGIAVSDARNTRPATLASKEVTSSWSHQNQALPSSNSSS